MAGGEEAEKDAEGSGGNRSALVDRVLRATLSITIAHFLAKIMGLVQASIIGHYYGFGSENDVFILAFELLIWSFYLIGEESLGPAFLPVFMEAKAKASERDAWKFTSTVLNLQILLLMGAIAFLMLFPAEVISWVTLFDNNVAKKLAKLDGEGLNRSRLAIHYLTWMAPSLLGFSIGSLTYMILNGYKKFFWPAFADAALKIGMVGGLVLGRLVGLHEDALIAAVLAAGVIKLLVHVIALRGKLSLLRPGINFRDPWFRKMTILIAPLLVGILYAKFRDYYNDAYIMSSLEPGMLSINKYGKKIFNALGMLIPYPLSIAMFPYFCEMVDRNDAQALGGFLTDASRKLLVVFVPVSAVLVVLSVPLAQVLFQTGKVNADQAALAGYANACYILVLPFYTLEYIFMQAYFSARRTISVTIIGIIFSSVSMGVSYLGVLHFNISGPAAVMVVALGYTFSRCLKTITLVSLLKFSGMQVLPLGPLIVYLGRVFLLTVACTGASFGALYLVEGMVGSKDSVKVSPWALVVDGFDVKEDGKGRDVKKKEAIKGGVANDEEGNESSSGLRDAEQSSKRVDQKLKTKKTSKLQALLSSGPRLVVPAVVAIIVFLLGWKILRFTELDEMWKYALEKLKRFRNRKKSSSAGE